MVISSTSAQEFPDGFIAYTPSIACGDHLCTDGIKIIDLNSGESHKIEAEPGYVFGAVLSWSADQDYIAYMADDFSVHIVDAETLAEVDILDLSDKVSDSIQFSWHPTLPLITFSYLSEEGGADKLALYDFETSELTPLAEDFEVDGGELPAWSPDGRYMVFSAAGENFGIEAFVFDSEQEDYMLIADPFMNFRSPAWSSDNRQLVFVSGDSQLMLIDMTTYETQPVYEYDGAIIGKADWVLDDQAISFLMDKTGTYRERYIYLLDLESRDLQEVIKLPQDSIGYDFSPDGTALAYKSSGNDGHRICIVDLTSLEETCLDEEQAHNIAYPVWSID